MKITIEFPDEIEPFKAMRYAAGAFLGDLPKEGKKGEIITFIDGASAYFSRTRTGIRLNIVQDGESTEDEQHG